MIETYRGRTKMHHSCLHIINSFLGRDQKTKSEGDQGSGTGSNGRGNIYHERQVKELCALHALNNLFQDAGAFTKAMLDAICHSLSPDNIVNPHKSMLGLGNYDINVLMAALHNKGYEAIWFDKRKDPSCIDLSKIVGFILNIPSEMKVGFLPLPLNRRHWIAVRAIQGIYYNLDSKLDHPVSIGTEEDVVSYLRDQIRSKDKEIFLVVSQDVERTQLWKRKASSRATQTTNPYPPIATMQDCNVAGSPVMRDRKKTA